MYWGLGNGMAAEQWPVAGRELVTGGTPRYQVYRTSDGRYLAAAPLEPKFWHNFLTAIDALHLEDDSKDPDGVRLAVASLIAKRTAKEWEERFNGLDVCVSVVRSLDDAVKHPHFAERGLFTRRVTTPAGGAIPALPVPVASQFRSADMAAAYPSLSSPSSRK
jgi:crotonobetainyl-CoA:carnitine CoA-transferase CaiB-like acyl-CoA transferase